MTNREIRKDLYHDQRGKIAGFSVLQTASASIFHQK